MNLIKGTATEEEVNKWYLTHLAYGKEWKSLIDLLKIDQLKEYHSHIASLLERQFTLDALDYELKKPYYSSLVQSLPKPDTDFARRIAYLFHMADITYKNIYLKLSENSKSFETELRYQ